MPSCKTAVTPLLTHWSYCSLALSHRYYPNLTAKALTVYSPNMHRVRTLLCFIVVPHWSALPISIWVTSLTLGQSYLCLWFSQGTLKYMGKYFFMYPPRTGNKITTKQNAFLWNKQYNSTIIWVFIWLYFDGLVHDCSNSSALAMEFLQSCTKPSISNLCS